uniref:Putative DNA double strand break repair n=1 Tax=Myoviridae sp. ctWb16 TaxID=2827690 RepID=A0A8S5T1I5_9CAUD|nr:MAG TPA: putative DNA double strand break repair [Myoviridae sp. ctWb16]
MKYIIFTDIHFGNKGNKDDFNEECLSFLNFVEEKTSKMNDIDGAIFLGDWFHNRNSINVKTLKYGIEGLYKFGSIGRGNSYLILGNHDLYYIDRRDVSSIFVPEGEIGVNIVEEPIYMENEKFLFLPWLINEEKLENYIKKYNPEYVFGHFEIPSFSFNKLIKKEGEYNPENYKGPKRILSGHFHLRQEKNNITYIGNCFSHDFSDVNDWHNKGFAILDTNKNELEYFEWENAPKYCTTSISKLNSIEFSNNMYLKLINDVQMKQMEVNQLKEELENLPNIVDCFIYPNELELAKSIVEDESLEHISNIEDLIVSLLNELTMENINNSKLIEIYKNLEINS